MENLLKPGIEHTDPNQLQFCLKISDEAYWYCEPNWYNEKMLPNSDAPERARVLAYLGHPDNLINDAMEDEQLKALVTNRQLWLSGSCEMSDFTEDEKHKLLDDYGYTWDDFDNDAVRNQIICEIYFEQNATEFRNDS